MERNRVDPETESVTCPCGSYDDFTPCDGAGREMAGTFDEGWPGLWRCDDCGRISAQGTEVVVGWTDAGVWRAHLKTFRSEDDGGALGANPSARPTA